MSKVYEKFQGLTKPRVFDLLEKADKSNAAKQESKSRGFRNDIEAITKENKTQLFGITSMSFPVTEYSKDYWAAVEKRRDERRLNEQTAN